MEENRSADHNIHIGHNITLLRHLRGLKQETLAEMIGITQQTMSHHEQQKIVNPDILKKISVALRIPVDILQNLEDENVASIIKNNAHKNTNKKINQPIIEDGENIDSQLWEIINLIGRFIEQQEIKDKLFEKYLNLLEKLIKKTRNKI